MKNRPELVARVAVVLLGGQRRCARETAQNQKARLRADPRRQAGQHASKALSLGRAYKALAVLASASAWIDRPRSSATC